MGHAQNMTPIPEPEHERKRGPGPGAAPGPVCGSVPVPALASQRIKFVLLELWLDLLALLWPCACLVCGVPDRDLCADCTIALRVERGHAERALTPVGIEVWAAGAYDGALRTLLVEYKHYARTRVGSVLGECLSGPLGAAMRARDGPMPVLIVTAPSRPEKVRARGFRHVDLLVRIALRYLARRSVSGSVLGLGGPNGRHGQCVRHERSVRSEAGSQAESKAYLVPGALQALPGRTGQVGLHAAQRAQNAALVRVPKRMRGRLRGRDVVLVDDIVTTGATLLAAARALVAAEARVVAIVVIGVTKRLDAKDEKNLQKRFRDEVEVQP